MKYMAQKKDTKLTNLIQMVDEKTAINVEKISCRKWEKNLNSSIEELKSGILNYHKEVSINSIYWLGELYSKLFIHLEVLNVVNTKGKRKFSYFIITYDDNTQEIRHKLKSVIKKETTNINDSLTYR